MKGQENIVAMRRAGFAPAYVWIQVADRAPIDAMTVCLATDDAPETLDWRFVYGLTALVEGEDSQMVERIARACGGFAKRVVSTVNVREQNSLGHSSFKVIEINDTEGHLTWHR